MTMAIDTVIFDIGGVLVKEGQRANILQQYGMPWTKRDHEHWQEYKLGRVTERDYWTRCIAGTPLAGRESEIAAYARQVYANGTPGGAVPLVAPLKKAGYRLAILSNHSTEWARAFLARQGLDEPFDPILISAEIGLAKPDPAVYAYTLWAAGRQDAPGRCVFIDDKIKNVEAARKAGMHAIRYEGPEPLEAELRALGVRW
jgi:HAD superfamily hydrolase (TIGR01509 family)